MADCNTDKTKSVAKLMAHNTAAMLSPRKKVRNAGAQYVLGIIICKRDAGTKTMSPNTNRTNAVSPPMKHLCHALGYAAQLNCSPAEEAVGILLEIVPTTAVGAITEYVEAGKAAAITSQRPNGSFLSRVLHRKPSALKNAA